MTIVWNLMWNDHLLNQQLYPKPVLLNLEIDKYKQAAEEQRHGVVIKLTIQGMGWVLGCSIWACIHEYFCHTVPWLYELLNTCKWQLVLWLKTKPMILISASHNYIWSFTEQLSRLITSIFIGIARLYRVPVAVVINHHKLGLKTIQFYYLTLLEV